MTPLQLKTTTMAYQCSTHGVGYIPHRILAADHPLAGVFAVGRRSPASMRHAAAEVVGFNIGQRVRIHRSGKVGTVETINAADREVGLTFTKDDLKHGPSAWFCPSELCAQGAGSHPHAPLRPAVAVPA